MNRYERLFCKKYLEILADVEDMKGLETAAAMLREIQRYRHGGKAEAEEDTERGVVELG